MHAKWCMQQISRCTAMKAAVLHALLSDGGAGTVDLLNRELGLNFLRFVRKWCLSREVLQL